MQLGRVLAPVMAGLYFAGLWLNGVGVSLLAKILPRSINLFLTVAALFPDADHYVLDYRAQAYTCDGRTWVELDTRPYFPIDAENKESRFQRVMYFHHKNARTMRALDAFLVDRHDGRGPGSDRDGIPLETAIGGVRLMALHTPFAPPGGEVRRYGWRPLSTYPESERHAWYETPRELIAKRCGAPPPADDPSAPGRPGGAEP